MLDIGSNIGASVLSFQNRFPKARIIGFEPHPDTFAILKQNVGDLPFVSVFNCGLGATNTRVTVPGESINFGAFSTKGRRRGQSEERKTVECEIRRLDDVLSELGIDKVDLIKIDSIPGWFRHRRAAAVTSLTTEADKPAKRLK